ATSNTTRPTTATWRWSDAGVGRVVLNAPSPSGRWSSIRRRHQKERGHSCPLPITALLAVFLFEIVLLSGKDEPWEV
ncbi:MAG: hypothetical protein ABL974_19970, partial [Prosthecobacter sp.]